MQVSLGVAVRSGWITKDAAGNYSEVNAVTTGAPDERQQEPNASLDDAAVPFESDAEAFATQFASQIDPSIQTAIIESIIGSDGNMDGLDISQAAVLGMSAGEFQGGVDSIRDAFQRRTDASLRAQGIEPQDFYAHIWEDDPEGTRRAMRDLTASRNPKKAFAGLVTKYMDTVAPSATALTRGGYRTETRNGVAMVEIPGSGWTTVAAAVKARLI